MRGFLPFWLVGDFLRFPSHAGSQPRPALSLGGEGVLLPVVADSIVEGGLAWEQTPDTVRNDTRFILEGIRCALKLLDEKPRPRVDTAIHLGCGSGHYVLALLQEGWQVTALDISPENIQLVQERTKEYSACPLHRRRSARRRGGESGKV
ncbi:hypothetical protein GCM10017783_10400 [Deinococcus piscis]|uniref:Methyltransferase domain-containing protein n=1 Tax=Deinococcus piscis TaxID=394230 RepID=A0ABQ3K471_9DEIO|nr:hypothetical protein GCM10017783_10400 [Deinococcus piscis]